MYILCKHIESHFTKSNSLFVQTYLANKTDSDSDITYSGENKYLNPCRFRKFGHLQRNVWSIIVMVGVF